MVSDQLQAPVLGRYRTERELGRDGLAIVYVAHVVKQDRDVAIKVLHPDLGGERVLTEIRTTARSIVARLVLEGPRPLVVQHRSIPGHVEAAVLPT